MPVEFKLSGIKYKHGFPRLESGFGSKIPS